jgi:hypothetical protein
MKTPLLALALLAACATPPAHPPDRDSAATAADTTADTASVRRPEAMASQAPAAAVKAETTATRTVTRGVDSARAGDSLTFSWWTATVTRRTIVETATSVNVDSAVARLLGVPFGMFASWNGSQLQPNQEWATMGYGGTSPQSLPGQIAYARSHGIKMVTTTVGGGRCNYLTPVCDANGKPVAGSKFDMAKWMAAMRRYDTPELRALVAKAVKDRVLIGNSTIDEPHNNGGPGNEQNSWGPTGTLNTARVDSLCAESKRIFPTLPAGVFQNWSVTAAGGEWAGQKYKVCDFASSQYRTSKGTLADYRSGALAEWKRQGIAGSFAFNPRDGGTPAKKLTGQKGWPAGAWKPDAPGDCASTTGGRGSYFPNCQMTPEQFFQSGIQLIPYGCFGTGFRYTPAMFAQAAYRLKAKQLTDSLKVLPRTSCSRPT